MNETNQELINLNELAKKETSAVTETENILPAIERVETSWTNQLIKQWKNY